MDATHRPDHLVQEIRRLLWMEQRLATAARPAVAAELQRVSMLAAEILDVAEAHATTLRGLVGEAGDMPGPANRSETSRFGEATAVIEELVTQLSGLVAGYAGLHTAAMRLFDPPLRRLAPAHFRACSTLLQTVLYRYPQIVASDLAARGLGCNCPCPMCSIGICGCVAGATATLQAAWRESGASAPDQPGYRLQDPRPGSQLAEAGIAGEAFLLSVGPVAAPIHDAVGVQGLVNGYKHGEDIPLTIIEGDRRRQLVVRRADTVAP